METVRLYISMITIRINRLNSPIKRHRVAGWIFKNEEEFPDSLTVRTTCFQ